MPGHGRNACETSLSGDSEFSPEDEGTPKGFPASASITDFVHLAIVASVSWADSFRARRSSQSVPTSPEHSNPHVVVQGIQLPQRNLRQSNGCGFYRSTNFLRKCNRSPPSLGCLPTLFVWRSSKCRCASTHQSSLLPQNRFLTPFYVFHFFCCRQPLVLLVGCFC